MNENEQISITKVVQKTIDVQNYTKNKMQLVPKTKPKTSHFMMIDKINSKTFVEIIEIHVIYQVYHKNHEDIMN